MAVSREFFSRLLETVPACEVSCFKPSENTSRGRGPGLLYSRPAFQRGRDGFFHEAPGNPRGVRAPFLGGEYQGAFRAPFVLRGVPFAGALLARGAQFSHRAGRRS